MFQQKLQNLPVANLPAISDFLIGFLQSVQVLVSFSVIISFPVVFVFVFEPDVLYKKMLIL